MTSTKRRAVKSRLLHEGKKTAEIVSRLRSGNLDLKEALKWHFTENHQPPLPTSLMPIAIDAANAARSGAWGKLLDLPEGMVFKGRTKVKASEVVEALKLDHFVFDESSRRPSVDPDGRDEVVMDFGDGFAWLNLNRSQCDAEGTAMQHCGHGGYDKKDNTTLFSLRKKMPDGRWRPHVTAVVDTSTGRISDLVGRGGQAPSPKYHKYIDALLKSGIVQGGFDESKKAVVEKSFSFNRNRLSTGGYRYTMEVDSVRGPILRGLILSEETDFCREVGDRGVAKFSLPVVHECVRFNLHDDGTVFEATGTAVRELVEHVLLPAIDKKLNEVGEISDEDREDIKRWNREADLDAQDTTRPWDDDTGTSQTARELHLYADNDATLYHGQRSSIEKNLINKRARGVYDHALAVKLWMYFVDAAAKKYVAEYDAKGGVWHQVFPKSVRMEVAETFANNFEREAELGNYDHLLHKKYKS